MVASSSVVEQSTRAASASTSRRKPTDRQILALALIAFVLLVPLCAITAAIFAPLIDSVPGWLGAAITTCAQVAVCAAVVAGGKLWLNA